MGAFVVPAWAASCFTDTGGHWAESFICWLFNNGISSGYPDGTYRPNNGVTRGEMAVFLQNAAEVPPSTGQILIGAGFGQWVPFDSADPVSFDYFSGRILIQRSSTGSNWFSVHPDIPTVLYGKSLRLTGVEFCYDAATGNNLNSFEINKASHSAGEGDRVQLLFDSTNRNGPECRLYNLASAQVLTAEDVLNVFVNVTWTTANTSFEIGRTTFVLEPTTTDATPPSGPVSLGSQGASEGGDTNK
jgi:hypothetical protein